MKTRNIGLIATIILSTACGAENSETTPVNDTQATPDGHRELVEPDEEAEDDSRFRPAALEASVDTMKEQFVTAEVDADAAVGVVLKSLNKFWRPVSVGASRALGELEVAGAVQGSTEDELDVPARVEQQLDFVEEQRTLGFNAFAIAPHNEDLSDAINAIKRDGLPVVTIDSDLPDTARDIYIGTDNPQAGITGAESLLEELDGRTGRILLLGNTDPAWVGGYERTNAAAEVLEAAGNEVEILNSIWVPEEDTAQLSEALVGGAPNVVVVGMLGVFANAYTCATAAMDADVSPMPAIVAFDFEPETLAYLEDGAIAATHVQRQYYMGYLATYVAYSIKVLGLEATKESVGDHLVRGFHLDTGLDRVRAEDLSDYDEFMSQLGI